MFTGKWVRFLAGVEKAIGNQSLSLAGKTGVVRKVTTGAIVVTMDRPEPLLDEWGNEVIWTYGEILYNPQRPELVEPWECLKEDNPDSVQLSCLRFFMCGYLASLCEVLSIEDEWEEKSGYLNTVGTPCGGNADWSVSTWHLGPGVPNRTSGGYYILDCEDDEGTFALVRRFFDEDTGDNDRIVTISESKTPWGLVEIFKAIRITCEEEKEPRQVPSVDALVSIGLFHDDIDAACYAVQTALGVNDGGLAGQMLTGDDWRANFEEYVEMERRGVIENLQEKTR